MTDRYPSPPYPPGYEEMNREEREAVTEVLMAGVCMALESLGEEGRSAAASLRYVRSPEGQRDIQEKATRPLMPSERRSLDKRHKACEGNEADD